ncbi:MAG: FecR domain-containing protein, partial [Acidobacteriota bacterium]
MLDHVKERLSKYCLGELAAEQSREVAEHLLACQQCRMAYEEVKLGVSFASQLKPVPAPLDLWPEIAARLDSSTLKSQSSYFGWRPLTAMAAALILVTVWSFWYISRQDSWLVKNYPTPTISPTLAIPPLAGLTPMPVNPVPAEPVRADHRPPRPPGASLEVLSVSGRPLIASNAIEGKGRLSVGEWLETDGQSRARISIADLGRVEVDPNSRISLLVTRSSEHRLNLTRGRVHAQIIAPPRLFIVETPTATAVDLGCEYTLEVDEGGGSVLRVTAGYVSLENKGRESVVPAGAICLTRPTLGPGTPYFEDASESFRKAVSEFDLGRGRLEALQVILKE